MAPVGFTLQHRVVGRAAAWAVSLLIVLYVFITILGFLSLKSPQDPISDPYFFLMELLIILMMPFMLVAMVAVHYYAAPERKVYSLTALAFMILLAGFTDCLHFVILTFGRQVDASGLSWMPLFLSLTGLR